MSFLLIVLAGAVGSVCRYGISGFVQRSTRSAFPLGTLAVNLAGAFLIGLVAGTSGLDQAVATAVLGFLGGLTTFSTWMVETLRLGLTRLAPGAVANLAVTLATGVALAALGYSLAV